MRTLKKTLPEVNLEMDVLIVMIRSLLSFHQRFFSAGPGLDEAAEPQLSTIPKIN